MTRAGRVVIVFGRQTAQWMQALAPAAPAWSGLDVDVIVAPTPLALARAWLGAGPESIVLPLMERHIAFTPPFCRALRPSQRALRVLGDKLAFALYAQAHGLGALVPANYAGAAAAQFPCVVKRCDLDGGRGIAAARNAAELAAVLAEPLFFGQKLVVQELVDGAGDYVSHCVAVEGRVVWQCAYEYELHPGHLIRSASTLRGVQKHQVSAANLAAMQRFLGPLRYSGPACFDYRYRTDGSLAVFEINPRLGGSLMFPAHVGDLRAALVAILAHAA